MLKKTIEYTDFNGTPVKENFYFNLTEAELTEWEAEVDGGLSVKLMQITDANDNKMIMKYMKEIVMRSYGIKSDDGKRFQKSEEISLAFTQSPAYNVLFMEFIEGGEDTIAAFVNGIMPAKLMEKAQPSVNPNDR